MKKTALLLSISFLSIFPLLSHAETSKTLPIIEQQKQVAGYYQYQAGNVQITALLDGTNFMSPTLFKDIPQQQVHDILKKYYADQEKGVQTSVNAFLVNTGKSLVLVDSGAASCFGAHLGSVLTNLKAALAPYQAKQRFKTYKLGDEIQSFKVISTAGHTPGHFSYALKTDSETVVFIGDIVHSHTVQFDRPKTAIEYDINPQQAVQTRLKQFADFAKNGQTIAAPHLPFPGIGHVYSADGKSYQWIPVHFKD
ncbi:MBL fold metallo-hydrolase [Acinetobacter soli]|uniref:MBL fold metallo-hydrolase n=1 Tax=Acinetobacter soli TaxID=487316 RepID=UPI000B4C3FB3|nr:MBL fold metallo-hydrolase [Acinetobacter soli]